MERIYTKGKAFVDEKGRERVFNGVNFCLKNEKISTISEEDINRIIDFFNEKGFNLVRLGINWSEIENYPFDFDENEIDAIRTFLDKCAKYDIYVFLDIHQDLYANIGRTTNPFGAVGNGAPKWACLTDGHKFPVPYLVWAQGYFIDKGVHSCFDHFWNNDTVYGKGLLDHFANMWKKLAKELADHPAFFGFDFLNEPFPGSSGKNVFTSIVKSAVKTTMSSAVDKKKILKSLTEKEPLPKILGQFDYKTLSKITSPANKYLEDFDKNLYMPFVNKMASAVREVTDNGIILIENSYYSNLGIPFSGKPAEINGKRAENQAFAPHAYDFMVDTPTYKYADDNRVGGIFSQRRKEQKENMDMPIVVGEWGGHCQEGTEWLSHIEYLLDLFDSYKWSNTYFAYYDFLKDNEVWDVISRPYPIAVTGEITRYHHDRRKNTYTIEYNQDEAFDGATEIFVNREIEKIETDGEYEITAKDGSNSVVKIKTPAGNHKTVIYFKGKGKSYRK